MMPLSVTAAMEIRRGNAAVQSLADAPELQELKAQFPQILGKECLLNFTHLRPLPISPSRTFPPSPSPWPPSVLPPSSTTSRASRLVSLPCEWLLCLFPSPPFLAFHLGTNRNTNPLQHLQECRRRCAHRRRPHALDQGLQGAF